MRWTHLRPRGSHPPFDESDWDDIREAQLSLSPLRRLEEAVSLLDQASRIEVAVRVLVERLDFRKAEIFLIEAERRRAMARRIGVIHVN